MPRRGVTVDSSEAIADLRKDVVILDRKEIGEELANVSEVSLAELVTTTEEEDYGFPADAKERFM